MLIRSLFCKKGRAGEMAPRLRVYTSFAKDSQHPKTHDKWLTMPLSPRAFQNAGCGLVPTPKRLAISMELALQHPGVWAFPPSLYNQQSKENPTGSASLECRTHKLFLHIVSGLRSGESAAVTSSQELSTCTSAVSSLLVLRKQLTMRGCWAIAQLVKCACIVSRRT